MYNLFSLDPFVDHFLHIKFSWPWSQDVLRNCYMSYLYLLVVVFNLIYKFTTSVRPSTRQFCILIHRQNCRVGARVRHRRTTGPGPAKTGEGLTGCDGGQHGRAGHGRVPAGPSPESRPIQVPSPNAQASKTRTIKKNLARAGRRPGVWNRGSKY
jgi:hypothetical protein